MIKAVVYDIDNTLTSDVSWLRITELLGASVATHEDIFRRFSAHELSYKDAKHQLVQLWQATGKANKAHWEAMFANWSLKDDASLLVDYAHGAGYQSALITGSVDMFAEAIAGQLSVSHWYANTTLLWDEAGELIDFHYVRDQAAQKLTHLREFADQVGAALDECVTIGDGDNDIEIFRATGRGIAVGSASPALVQIAWQHVDELSEVIGILAKEAKS